MRCTDCPRPPGLACLGERLPHLCGRPDYREYLRNHDPEQRIDRGPGLLERARNLATAVVDHVADGGRIAPPEVQEERRATCFGCPLHDHARDACTKCGCGMNPALSFAGVDLALKRSWASSVCPDRPPRWGAS